MSEKSIRVRFAPSPTGYLHIGGARTALFNWLYARAQKGAFILRIEDTDQARSKKEFLDEICESLDWLGLKGDEVFYQSERFALYREYAQKLLDEKKAYQDGEAVILKIPQKTIKIFDIIRGEIVFDSATIKDQVLMKSDGSPAYSFACVVDDALMNISHVIRGEDHISNTPKQILIYEALGFRVPKFAHLPLILAPDGSRLSKRAGAVAVTEYRQQGFLPEALVNYLLLLGWSPGGNQEKIDLSSAIKKFSLKKVNKTGAVFSIDKLRWINAQYIKALSTEDILSRVIPLWRKKGWIGEKYDWQHLQNIVDLYKGRCVTLNDFCEWTEYLFVDEYFKDGEACAQHLSEDRSGDFNALADRLEKRDAFSAQEAEEVFREYVAERGIKASELVHPVRVALTGRAVGPGLFETMAVLGKDKTVFRLRQAFAPSEKVEEKRPV